MKLRLLLVAVLVGAGDGFAQSPDHLPPLALPRDAHASPLETPLPTGTPVSRPLTPVANDQPVFEPDAPKPEPAAVRLPSSWQNYELLFWWTKATPLPPLVRVAGGPLLAGGRSLDNHEAAGGRFTLGQSLNNDRTFGIEATYLFLGTRSYERGFDRDVIVRPFRDARSGAADELAVNVPGLIAGTVVAATSSRVSGWEVGGVANLSTTDTARLNAIVGYRYFLLNEGLRIDQTSFRMANPFGPTILGVTGDQFDAHNRFHGGQVGLSLESTLKGIYVGVVGKVAFGEATNIVRVSGDGRMYTAGNPLPLIQTFPGGVLAQPSNIGRSTTSGFAVLPEAQLKLGWRFSDRSQMFVGYNFIYLSRAVRPGDQVDTSLDPAGVPYLPAYGTLAAVGRPRREVVRTDAWVQGLTVGVEYRY